MGLEGILQHRDWEGGIPGRKARFVLGDVNGHSYWVEGLVGGIFLGLCGL